MFVKKIPAVYKFCKIKPVLTTQPHWPYSGCGTPSGMQRSCLVNINRIKTSTKVSLT